MKRTKITRVASDRVVAEYTKRNLMTGAPQLDTQGDEIRVVAHFFALMSGLIMCWAKGDSEPRHAGEFLTTPDGLPMCVRRGIKQFRARELKAIRANHVPVLTFDTKTRILSQDRIPLAFIGRRISYKDLETLVHPNTKTDQLKRAVKRINRSQT